MINSMCVQFNFFVGLCVFATRFSGILRKNNIIDLNQSHSLYKLFMAGTSLIAQSKLSRISIDSVKLALPYLLGCFLVMQEDKEIKWTKLGLIINIGYLS